jgi:hypothetical protein
MRFIPVKTEAQQQRLGGPTWEAADPHFPGPADERLRPAGALSRMAPGHDFRLLRMQFQLACR